MAWRKSGSGLRGLGGGPGGHGGGPEGLPLQSYYLLDASSGQLWPSITQSEAPGFFYLRLGLLGFFCLEKKIRFWRWEGWGLDQHNNQNGATPEWRGHILR